MDDAMNERNRSLYGRNMTKYNVGGAWCILWTTMCSRNAPKRADVYKAYTYKLLNCMHYT